MPVRSLWFSCRVSGDKIRAGTRRSASATVAAPRMAPMLRGRLATARVLARAAGVALPGRSALHRRLTLGVCDPHFHAGVGFVGVDREFPALEQRLHPAIAEFLRR